MDAKRIGKCTLAVAGALALLAASPAARADDHHGRGSSSFPHDGRPRSSDWGHHDRDDGRWRDRDDQRWRDRNDHGWRDHDDYRWRGRDDWRPGWGASYDWRGSGASYGWRGCDRDEWGRGHWRHEVHDGRLAWWWVVGDLLFAFGHPSYDVPVYGSSTVVIREPAPVVVASAPPPPPPVVAAPSYGAPPSGTGYWYYCPSAGAYYPYVAQCPENWEAVVPQAPGQYR